MIPARGKPWTIRFQLPEEPRGAYWFRIDFTNVQQAMPPRYVVTVGNRLGAFQLEPGGSIGRQKHAWLAAGYQQNVTFAPESAIRQWLDGQISEGHGVITYENIRLPALVYPWTGEQRLLQASLNVFAWIGQRHMLPYRLPSAEEYLSGVGAFRKTETCNVAAQMWSNVWMYRILGAGSYGDQVERVFFNAGPAPIARDFQTMCYYQSPNRLRSDSLPCEEPRNLLTGGIRFHRFGCPERPVLRGRHQPHHSQPDQKGFACIARSWSKGDVLDLRFPMSVQVVRGYETEFPAVTKSYFYYEPAAVFNKRRLPYASVGLGPLLFALPIPDKDPNTPVGSAGIIAA